VHKIELDGTLGKAYADLAVGHRVRIHVDGAGKIDYIDATTDSKKPVIKDVALAATSATVSQGQTTSATVYFNLSEVAVVTIDVYTAGGTYVKTVPAKAYAKSVEASPSPKNEATVTGLGVGSYVFVLKAKDYAGNDAVPQSTGVFTVTQQ